ncbi:hypothetical protein FOPE_10521 [Fonsecaea pedrosoi]|nr:hypothetical protein FOPE_10521 [Fonsecaea pedrosoi]
MSGLNDTTTSGPGEQLELVKRPQVLPGQGYACDACRTRKTKCDKTKNCSNCIRLKLVCTFGHVRTSRKHRKHLKSADDFQAMTLNFWAMEADESVGSPTTNSNGVKIDKGTTPVEASGNSAPGWMPPTNTLMTVPANYTNVVGPNYSQYHDQRRVYECGPDANGTLATSFNREPYARDPSSVPYPVNTHPAPPPVDVAAGQGNYVVTDAREAPYDEQKSAYGYNPGPNGTAPISSSTAPYSPGTPVSLPTEQHPQRRACGGFVNSGPASGIESSAFALLQAYVMSGITVPRDYLPHLQKLALTNPQGYLAALSCCIQSGYGRAISLQHSMTRNRPVGGWSAPYDQVSDAYTVRRDAVAGSHPQFTGSAESKLVTD